MKLVTRTTREKNKGSFYGSLDKSPSKGVGAWDLRGVGQKASLISITLDRLKSDRMTDILAYTFQTPCGVSTEYKELETVRDNETFEREKAMLASYERIIKMKDVENISLEKFALELKENFSNDIRTAYKLFNVEKDKNASHCVYIYHIYALIVATITLIGDIDFMPPIKMKFKKNKSILKMDFSMSSRKHRDIKNRMKLRDIQGIEAKLAYIAAICREDNINCTLKFTNNSLAIEYDVCAIEPHKGIVYSKPDERKYAFSELMNLFSYTVKDTETEAQEEE